jgi:hypothetical protein
MAVGWRNYWILVTCWGKQARGHAGVCIRVEPTVEPGCPGCVGLLVLTRMQFALYKGL